VVAQLTGFGVSPTLFQALDVHERAPDIDRGIALSGEQVQLVALLDVLRVRVREGLLGEG